MSRHLSTLRLHEFRYGELAGEALDRARTHLAQCERCSARLMVQEQERAAFVLEPVPPVLRLPASSPSPRPAWLRYLPLILVAAAVALVVIPALRPAEGPADRIAFRGEAVPSIEVWVDRGNGVRPLHDDDRLHAGDRVQLRYDPTGAAFAAAAGRDNTGAIEVYGSFPTRDGGLVDAPFALTLDEAPGIQELFLVLGDSPLDSATVQEAIVRHPEPTPGVRVVETHVQKESPDP